MRTTEASRELPPAAAAPSLKRRAVRGTVLSFLNVGGAQILRLAGNLITTRLLFPEAYGLMLMVLVLNQGLHMISDVGIVPSIIQHERGEERDFLNTAWTIQLGRGALISILAALLAWPYSHFYGQPQLLPLILVSSIQGVILGFDSTKLATLNRRIEVGRLVFINLTAQSVTFVVMVTWAYLSPSVWALLGGAIAGDLTRTCLSHVAIPGPTNRFRWERDAARVIFDFGKWIFLSTLVTYLGIRFDSLALGKLIDLESLGIYNIGQNLASLPVLVTGQIAIWVLLPALSEAFRDDASQFFAHVARARRVLNAVGVLMVAGTGIAAPAFFYFLYDPRYHEAGWMVQILMLPTWFFFLGETAVRVQLAMGESRMQMIANAVKLVGTIPGALGGYWLGERVWGNGLPGLILGMSAGALIGYSVIAWSMRKRGLHIFATDMRWTAAALALGLTGGLTPWIVGPMVGVAPPIASLVIGTIVIVPYAIYAGFVVRAELKSDIRS